MVKEVQTAYEVSVAFKTTQSLSTAILKSIILNYGIDELNIIERYEESDFFLSVFFNTQEQAKRLAYQLNQLDLNNVIIDVVTHHPDEWLNAWKRDWKPFSLTPHIDVVPAWLTDDFHSTKKHVIYLDTVSAFGTGLHETTQFMAAFIEECAGGFQSFLDIGTGTGILAAVARMMHAHPVWAIDIDEHSIAVAQQNFDRNGFVFDFIEAHDIGAFSAPRRFDFVAANLITQDLVTHSKKIVSFVEEDGLLALSGIAKERLGDVLAHFNDHPFTTLKKVEGQKWSAVLFKRR